MWHYFEICLRVRRSLASKVLFKFCFLLKKMEHVSHQKAPYHIVGRSFWWNLIRNRPIDERRNILQLYICVKRLIRKKWVSSQQNNVVCCKGEKAYTDIIWVNFAKNSKELSSPKILVLQSSIIFCQTSLTKNMVYRYEYCFRYFNSSRWLNIHCSYC